VGPGRPIDTQRYFVICPNVVGGCMGATGPASTNPATGMPWGLDFPVITIRDMVRVQHEFVTRGLERSQLVWNQASGTVLECDS